MTKNPIIALPLNPEVSADRYMYIVYGLSGSGKSTLAEKLAHRKGAVHLELDTYFEIDGDYLFDFDYLESSVEYLYFRTKQVVTRTAKNLVVSDVFYKRDDLERFIKLATSNGVTVKLLTPNTFWSRDVKACAKKNIHGVTEEVMQLMYDGISEWEHIYCPPDVLASDR